MTLHFKVPLELCPYVGLTGTQLVTALCSHSNGTPLLQYWSFCLTTSWCLSGGGGVWTFYSRKLNESCHRCALSLAFLLSRVKCDKYSSSNWPVYSPQLFPAFPYEAILVTYKSRQHDGFLWIQRQPLSHQLIATHISSVLWSIALSINMLGDT